MLNEDIEMVAKLYQAGLSLRAIGDKLGRSHQYAYRRLKKAAISRRPYQGSGPMHSQWIGGRLPAGEGYWRVWIPNDDPYASMRDHQGYVKEHRLNMARALGRPLTRQETVHHINGDNGDNRLENLQLRHGKHGKHGALCCHDCGSQNIGPAPLSGNGVTPQLTTAAGLITED